ncbi:hypothetical protein Tco_1161558 [Tanacetum coccineum]
MEEEEEDRISLLPDCLILEILSRLPSTKEAIKTVEAFLDYDKQGYYDTTAKEADEEMLRRNYTQTFAMSRTLQLEVPAG